MQGGYYAVNVTDEIIMISINGIYPFYSNTVDQESGTLAMFAWLQSIFDNNPNKKFMTQVHVYPGNNFYEEALQ